MMGIRVTVYQLTSHEHSMSACASVKPPRAVQWLFPRPNLWKCQNCQSGTLRSMDSALDLQLLALLEPNEISCCHLPLDQDMTAPKKSRGLA